MNNYNKNYYALIMAGGVGSRFWPVSRVNYPKQFQDLMGVGETLIQQTYHRLSTLVPLENILILTNTSYKDIVKEQLPLIKEDQILLEPQMRNTAPCILLAALKIQKQNPDAVMIVAPSDHWIIDKEAFLNDVNSAFNEASKKDILVTLGIKPSFPNTGYGYIKYIDEELSLFPGYRVQKFTEKPSLRNAKKFLEDGNYLWNAGIFIWKAAAIVDSFKEHSQDMYELFGNGYDLLNEKQEVSFIEEAYPKAQNISIDYAILEKSDKVFVIPATFDWDDLGTWGALYGKLAKDTSKNAVVNADLIPLTSHGNMVYSHNNKVVILEGLENYIVVESNDVLLIVPKEKEQEIKEIRTRAIERLGEKLG